MARGSTDTGSSPRQSQIGQGQRPEKLGNGQPNISGDWAQEQVVMTDPRGQIGTLVPLSQVEEIRATGDLEARGAIPGARNTEQAEAAQTRRVGRREGAAAAATPNRGGGAAGRGGGGAGRLGGARRVT